jgi:hypothetical protein
MLTALGSVNAASGTVTSGYLSGYIKAIYIDASASITPSTDITIATVYPVQNILILTNIYTDGWYYPLVQGQSYTGSAISGQFGRFPVDDQLKISAAEGVSGTVADITLFVGQ